MSQTPAGWYDDGQGAQRWWDGTRWTEHTQPGPGGAAGGDAASPGDSSDGTGSPSSDSPADLTQYGGQSAGPSLDKPASDQPPAAPASADVTMVAPQGPRPGPPGGYGQPGQQPPGQAPGYPAAGGYQGGQPGQPGYPGQPGQPGQPSWQHQYGPGPGGGGGGKGKLFALLGGGAVAVIVVIVLLFVVLGGGGGAKGKAEDLFDALKDGDCGYGEHLSNAALGTDEDGRDDAIDATRDQCEEFADDDENNTDGCDIELSNEDVVEEDERVTFDYEITGCDDEEQNVSGATIVVVKEHDEWRVEDF